MRHVLLTCRNHPDLRWSCKQIAFTPTDDGGRYNGERHIFFQGYGCECDCPASDLRLAPEDIYASMTLEEQRAAVDRW